MIIFSRIYLTYMLNIGNERMKITIRVSFWGITFYKKDLIWEPSLSNHLSSIVKQIEEYFDGEDYKKTPFTEKMNQMRKILPLFRRTIYVHTFHWKTVIGTKEANWTAILSGSLWSIKYKLLGMLDTYMNKEMNPSISIEPNFQTKIFCMEIKSISSVSLYKGIQLLFKLRQIK